MIRNRFLRTTFLSCLMTLCLTSCGGGGGGNNSTFVGAADVSLTVSPNSIDSHDRTQVKVRITNVIDTGILLKVRYPSKLSYAVNTAKLQLDSEQDGRQVDPSFNGPSGSKTYLVFFLSRSSFGDVSSGSGSETVSEPATLTFELIGDGRLADGLIEVDADVNDPTIPDSTEFNVSDPQFEPQSDASIEVKESSS